MQWFRAQGGQSARHSLVCLLMLLFMACQAVAQGGPDPALQKGQQWLQAQAKPDGSLASEAASPALPAQSRHETVAALKALNASVPATLIAGMDGFTAPATRYLAQRALTRQQAGADDASLLDALAALQNPNGSFGAAQGLPGNALDTAWALRALAASRASAQATLKALQWLASAQHADGSWPLAPDGDATITTALAAQALLPWRQQPAAQAALAKARAWLTAQRNPQQAWSSDLHTAQALLAVLPGLDTAAAMQPALTALKQAQRPDGSWAGDPHLTALALRALRLAAQPATNPDLASVRGQVVDEAGKPIAGLSVQLARNTQQTNTDIRGEFVFSGLPAGIDTLHIKTDGMQNYSAGLSLMPGQLLNLGKIILKALGPSNSHTFSISGVAYYSIDGYKWLPASNARISVGMLFTSTNWKGEYVLNNITPGTLNIRAEYSNSAYANFNTIETLLTAQAGEQIRFDPKFTHLSWNRSVKVVVTDASSGQPLPNAIVSLNGIEHAVNINGELTFSSELATENNFVSISAEGYISRSMHIKIRGAQHILLPVTLTPDTRGTTSTTLQGLITDAETHLPIPDATVRIFNTNLLTRTGADGHYILSDVPAGQNKILIEKPITTVRHRH